MKQFKLTDIQAEDILEIRLRQLARLEGIKIQNELKELKIERKEPEGAARQRQPRCGSSSSKEIRDDAKKYGDDAPHARSRKRAARRSSARSSTSRSRSSSRATAGCARARATRSTSPASLTRAGDAPVCGVRDALDPFHRDDRFDRPRVQRAGGRDSRRQGRRRAVHVDGRARAGRAARARRRCAARDAVIWSRTRAAMASS